MTEAAGLALGVTGLGGLFSTCIQAFELAHIAKHREEELALIHVQLENQKVRFVSWGNTIEKQWTFEGYKETLDVIRYKAVASTLREIAAIFSRSHTLANKYGLSEVKGPDDVERSFQNTHVSSNLSHEAGRFGKFLEPISLIWSKTTKSTHWIIVDCKRFQALVEDLRKLIDDLEMLTDLYRSNPTVNGLIREESHRSKSLSTNKAESAADPRFLALSTCDPLPTVCASSGTTPLLRRNLNALEWLDPPNHCSGSIVKASRKPHMYNATHATDPDLETKGPYHNRLVTALSCFDKVGGSRSSPHVWYRQHSVTGKQRNISGQVSPNRLLEARYAFNT